VGVAREARAQGGYFNTDASHPLRVEDALATELFGLELHFPGVRFERLDSGAQRWRVEPSLSFGAFPRTAVEIRSSFVYREATARPRGGLSGIGFNVFHALNTETSGLPAVAVTGEVYTPVGGARTGSAAVAFRTIVRTTPWARFHFNATLGTYGATVPRSIAGCDTVGIFVNVACRTTPIIPDGPCSVDDAGAPSAVTPAAPVAQSSPLGPLPPTVLQRGRHWVAGVGADHAFALRSTLLMADLFAERYEGLFNATDWTAEVGLRHQLSPQVAIDAALGRRFRGVTRGWTVTLGATRNTPVHIVRTPAR
jgi:hypothetical protein